MILYISHIELEFLQNLILIRSVTSHELLFYVSDQNAVIFRLEPSYVFEPFLCFCEVLTVLSSRSVDLHLVCVVRLHPGMSFRNVATKRDCFIERERAVAAFEFWLMSPLFNGLTSSLFLDLRGGRCGLIHALKLFSSLLSL